MNRHSIFSVSLVSLVTGAAHASQVPVDQITYKAKTNVSAISVSGKCKSSPKAEVAVTPAKGNAPAQLSKFDLELSPNDLDSGLSLRDNHMREKIFQNPDGTVPPMKFALKEPTALSATPKPVKATLEIRGKVVDFSPDCSGAITGEGKKLKFDCKGLVNLDSYAIPAPSHMGVKVNPMVEIAVATEEDLKP